jgi:hypothetical protein
MTIIELFPGQLRSRSAGVPSSAPVCPWPILIRPEAVVRRWDLQGSGVVKKRVQSAGTFRPLLIA